MNNFKRSINEKSLQNGDDFQYREFYIYLQVQRIDSIYLLLFYLNYDQLQTIHETAIISLFTNKLSEGKKTTGLYYQSPKKVRDFFFCKKWK